MSKFGYLDQNRGLGIEYPGDIFVIWRLDDEKNKYIDTDERLPMSEFLSKKCSICGLSPFTEIYPGSCMLTFYVDKEDENNIGHANCFSENNVKCFNRYISLGMNIVSMSAMDKHFKDGEWIERPYGRIYRDNGWSISYWFCFDDSVVSKSKELVLADTKPKKTSKSEVATFNKFANANHVQNRDYKRQPFTERQVYAANLVMMVLGGLLMLGFGWPLAWTLALWTASSVVLLPTAYGMHRLASHGPRHALIAGERTYGYAREKVEVKNKGWEDTTNRIINLLIWWDVMGDDEIREITGPLLVQFSALNLTESMKNYSPIDTMLWDKGFRLIMDCVLESRDTDRHDEIMVWAKSFIDDYFTTLRGREYTDVLNKLLEVRTSVRKLEKIVPEVEEPEVDEDGQPCLPVFTSKSRETDQLLQSLTTIPELES